MSPFDATKLRNLSKNTKFLSKIFIKMDKKRMLEDLIVYYSGGNKTRFAAMLGLSPQTLSSWLSRGSFDSDLIYSKCVNLSAKWLLTGEGEMVEHNSVKASNDLETAAISHQYLSKAVCDLAEVNRRLTAELDELKGRKIKNQ